jgi:hypothetical protein
LATTLDANAPLVRPLDAEAARLAAVLEALPQESVSRRGVAGEAYFALLSAVDATVCSAGTADPSQAPTLPPEVLARLDPLRLEAEAQALARYFAHVGALPERVAGALTAFLSRNSAYGAGPPSWALAALAVRLQPERREHWLALLRENGALHRWRESSDRAAPIPDSPASLCNRERVVDRYAALASDSRALALKRYLAAPHADEPVEDSGLRWLVELAGRDEAAATLELHVRVSNQSSEARPLPALALRLAGFERPPLFDSPTDRLPPGAERVLRMRFADVSDAIAEAAVLVLPAGHVLQAYSELL